MSHLLLSCFAAFSTAIVVFFITQLIHVSKRANGRARDSSADKRLQQTTSAPVIEPLRDYDWRLEPPLKVWPFKPKYNLTMALETIAPQDLVAVDQTYLDRIELRRQLIKDHPAETVAARTGSEAMVYEFYDWMMGTYLPSRFPTMYTSNATEKGAFLHNEASTENIPLNPGSPLEALRLLGAHVDTDFLFLLPSAAADDAYHLEAFVACFPSGFSTREKLGLPLAAIHAPVPGYAAKLEKSMDRFFANLPVGKMVKRANWSITTDDRLFSSSGNHLYAGDTAGSNEKTLDVSSSSLDQDVARQRESVGVPACRLRCERQTLHRLPRTNALVFAFKTYQYTLAEVKENGSGEDLARAIEGLAAGNVPEMEFYKRGVVWGDKVKAYLRS